MIVAELFWAAAIAWSAYFCIQQVIKVVEEDRKEAARKRAAEEPDPLQEEPPREPWGTP
jgi:hypothetical protein